MLRLLPCLTIALAACSAQGPGAATRLSAAATRPSGAITPASGSRIRHLVVIEQENHTFDAYFGRYCRAAAPVACGSGRDCCEAAPAALPTPAGICKPDQSPLTDDLNGGNDPDHSAATELAEMDLSGGAFKMDRFDCDNVKYAQVPDDSWQDAKYPVPSSPDYPLRTYHNLAFHGALADRYFQPIAGASSSNDMFLARAGFVFQDNQAEPRTESEGGRAYADANVGDLLDKAGVPWGIYMEGFTRWEQGDRSPYPEGFDPTDNAFAYYQTTGAKVQDLSNLARDLDAGALPAVNLVRSLGIRSEHPGSGTKITTGEDFVRTVIQQVQASSAAAETLILITWDEGGGFYDHVPPPLALADGTPLPRTALPGEKGDQSHNIVKDPHGGPDTFQTLPATTDDPEYYTPGDGQEYYGTRLPFLAVGPFAKTGFVSHVAMEHSSIVRFIEWNWLQSQRLGTRDAHVNSIGDLLDPAATGVPVPST